MIKQSGYDEERIFLIQGDSGNIYVVKHTREGYTCSCQDYQYRKHNCKHISYVVLNEGVKHDRTN